MLSSTFLHIIFQETLKKIPSTILDRDGHSVEQDLLCDHRHKLILSILDKYFDIRIHHEGSSLEETVDRIRMRNNKMTIFSGQ